MTTTDRSGRAGAFAAVLTFAAAACAGAADAQTHAAVITLRATLTGAAERPTAGDPKGSGAATLRVDPAKGQVCYELQVKNVAPITMAHIHEAPPGESGPPLADLIPPGPDGKSSGCVEAGPIMLEGLTTNPTAYYLNVHNAQYRNGALRGQLHK